MFFSHPADSTPVCTTELGASACLADEFERRTTKMIALSVDSIEDHRGSAPDIGDVGGTDLNSPVVADSDREIAVVYDMIHPGEGDTSTVRSVVIVDALQMTDRAPVATPADWVPGQRLIASVGLSIDEANAQFVNVEGAKPYLRFVDAPSDEG